MKLNGGGGEGAGKSHNGRILPLRGVAIFARGSFSKSCMICFVGHFQKRVRYFMKVGQSR